MANKKTTAVATAPKKRGRPAKKTNTTTTKVKEEKTVKVEEVSVFDALEKTIAESAKKTYKIGKYEVKRSHVWAGVAVLLLLLIILF